MRRGLGVLACVAGVRLGAQEVDAERRVLPWLGGAAAALVVHEAGHLAANAIVGTPVTFRRVAFHGVPFFAVAHGPAAARRQEYVIAAAGFWSQYLASEWVLSRRPSLRDDRAPFAKGVLAFHVATSVGYALAAFAETGPAERDTRSMAVGARWPEPRIGALLLAPALLDTWRYTHRGSRAAMWASRGAKLGAVLLVLR